ncbi:LTXXQ motif family protein [Persephonella hydrogeniphila]|uniref:LTXXQ motif family protein n=1 Tax=Persephonella hydrogeniphila TaxID=198703 RepID=A0A285N1W7_9AQUI|nr:Spy/CpxP family protein refolding chaperone [Persephonella hydrogeniphila]SNZ02777.1 LTXXQ motif family protein [Persephonella hydrogeniphila]
MRIILSLLVVLVVGSMSIAQEEPTPEENNQITIDTINDDNWMDSAFLIKRFNFLPVLKKHKNELGLTDEQLKIINSFYSKYYKKMEELAKSIQEKEKQLSDLVINGGDSKKIKDLIIEIAKEKAELTVYNIKEVRTIQSALTKEQFEKLKNLTEQSII